MREIFTERLNRGEKWRIRCLPYYYIPGIAKCGTTDLHGAMLKHPDITKPPMGDLEPMFWNRIRMESKRTMLNYRHSIFILNTSSISNHSLQ